MFPFFTNPENRSRLLLLWIVSACVLVGGGTALWLRFYQPWRLERLTREAHEAVARGDYAAASLHLRRALQTAPDDLPACRLMAEVLEKGKNPEAITWRGRIAELSPGATDAALEWARVALEFRRYATAERALATVPELGRHRLDYLATAGKVAFDQGRHAEAEKLFAEAVARAPDNPAYHLALGRAEVLSTDFFVRDAGRRELRDLATIPGYGPDALRALVASYEASDEPAAALRESERRLRRPEHTFLDELAHLKLLRATQDERFAATLASLQEKAATQPNDASALIVWMGSAGLTAEAVEWATQREPKVGRTPEARRAIAGCYLQLEDWPAVLKITADPWRSAEYMRHAYRSRALRARGDLQLARTEWNLATTAAQGYPEAIRWLSRVAAKADWSDETEQALWMAVGNVPDPTWAIDQLGRRFHEQQDTEGLHRLATRYLANDPKNENIQNDLAFLSTLLGRETDRALIVAHELVRKHPENAAYASTYALALHKARRIPEALATLEKLPAAQLLQPPIAAHYGVILVASGRLDEARRYLELGRLAPLLPEEVALLDQAEQHISAAEVGKPER